MSFTYHSVEENEFEVEKGAERYIQSSGRSVGRWTLYTAFPLAIIALSATAVAGFLAGRLYSMPFEKKELHRPMGDWPKHIVELDSIPLTIVANRTYLEKPSPENAKIWEALYPDDHHGVFRWPDQGSQRAGFAGFHQLHCVDALRKRFYQEEEVREALIRGDDISTILRGIEMVHVLHCIEVLRTSVICHADNTLQVETSYLHGISAFGTTSECKDWAQMVNWVNERNKLFPL